MENWLAIHFGGAHTRFGEVENKQPVLLTLSGNIDSIPTVIAYDIEKDEFLIGEDAVAIREKDPCNAVWNLPCILYPSKTDSFIAVVNEMAINTIDFYEDNSCIVTLGGEKYRGEELVRVYFSLLKDFIEEKLGRSFDNVVITIPSGATIRHRTSLLRIAGEAGFGKCRLISEAGAFAMAEGFGTKEEHTACSVVLGYSASGGCVVEVEDGVFEVNTTTSQPFPGIWNTDIYTAEALQQSLQSDLDINIERTDPAFDSLIVGAGEARQKSSSIPDFKITIPSVDYRNGESGNVNFNLTGKKLKEDFQDITDWLPDLAEEIAESSKFDKLIVAHEEPTPAGAVESAAQDAFGRRPDQRINTPDSIVLGAAVLAGIVSGDFPELLLMERGNCSIGLEVAN
jgi:molecular chaperone DnaK